MDSYSAVVAGHICLDIIPSMEHLVQGEWASSFQPGRLLEVGPAALSTGGPVSNTGLALNKLGIATCLMGKVGRDVFGESILRILRSAGAGLEAGMIVDPAVDTSYSIILSPPGIDRIFLHDPAANDTFCAADVRYEQAAPARLFHFGYPPVMRRMYADGGSELAGLLRRVKSDGVTTSLDLAFPDPSSPGAQADWRAIFERVLPHVDVFLPSIEELLFLYRREAYRALSGRGTGGGLLDAVTPGLLADVAGDLIGMGAKIVAIKLGERGLYLRTAGQPALETMGRAAPSDPRAWAGRELWAPCFRVEVIGTTGSGDATIAGFLSALLRGDSPERAMTMAVAVGACNVEAPDALSGIRSWEATQARVAAGWPRLPLEVNAPGWAWDPTSGLWESGS